ncbi:efflux RND transporter periplasmic adaptor subunit [Robbsia sp. KACC 23696]|uniref:efflux RND transporter periplasmic adaptor subunit n=1 Tax=Robbsia sp. KACC 23696 TaxID=3149231 RepID=UPI00325B99DF
MPVSQRHFYSLAISAVFCAACSGSPPDAPAIVPPLVAALVVQARDVTLTQEYPGRIAPYRIAEIRPQVSGIVIRRRFEEGAEVREGQALFDINPEPFKADRDVAAATLRKADAALTLATVQADRIQPLVAIEAVSEQAYDEAISKRDQAFAEVRQARAALDRKQLDVRFATVEAPISGRIGQALVTEGALVGIGDATSMAQIQQIDRVYVDVRRPASSRDALTNATLKTKDDHSEGVPVTLFDADHGQLKEAGRILFSGLTVNASTNDVLLRITVDNAKRTLLPGMFVWARVPLAFYPAVLTIPQQAVVRSGNGPHVWTIREDGRAHLQPVELGSLVFRDYIVLQGLVAGSKVIVEGAERVSENGAVTTQPWNPPEADASGRNAATKQAV